MAYASISVEGGMFPADLLDRIAAGEGEGQRPPDFGLAAGRRITDETQGAFSEIRSYWEAFHYRLKRSSDSLTTLTRENWVIPLMQALGFERIEFQRSGATVGSESYAISHRAGAEPDATVVHIVAIDQRLDVRDGRRSPHALVQEYLNRSDAVWGIVTNGRQMRLLRDTARLAKPTYLEFNLETMVEANLYSEFVLLYRLLHASRFPVSGTSAHECFLERYYQLGIDQGGRVREKLRDGVAEALQILGSAFLDHPESHALRTRLESGALDASSYYRQLLRLVYRLLFLMAAEERKLVFPPETLPERQAVYDNYYSVGRLRDRCERRFGEDRYSDLWIGLRQTFTFFREDTLASKLGLHALNGELFGSLACADLERASCENRHLLAAMFRLSTYLDDKVRRRVNYAFLDVEEFGSVYESLLDFHPVVDMPARLFSFLAGTDRKSTGSYYTPSSLVHELIESALVPVVQERLAAARTRDAKEAALLALRVIDPAAGSGHFLLAAARRIAMELARVRSEEAEPPPAAYRDALRDVIRTCVYAVDKNPLAVDLCKVALWIEGHNAGLPLGFLDHHIKRGDSLVGVFDLSLLKTGIPDEAYKPVTGDDKGAAKGYREQNKKERGGQMRLGAFDPEALERALAPDFDALGELADDTPADVKAKERFYEELRAGGTAWWSVKAACDLWTYAFFASLQAQASFVDQTIPTTSLVWEALAGGSQHASAQGRAMQASQEHSFFHWHLEFPDVFARGGFDVIVGNPPFMGGQKISGNLGENYRDFLSFIYAPARATCDLCGYVYRRVYSLLRPSGRLGMVAVNTISQGDTREGGLAVVSSQGGRLTFVEQFVQWHGAANVEVSLVGIQKAPVNESVRPIHNGNVVDFISSRFDNEPEQEAFPLLTNKRKSFQGSILQGMGFVLSNEEAQNLISSDVLNSECIFPYLNGEDINATPNHKPSRQVINFFDWSESRAQRYAEPFRIVETRVKPERQKINRQRNKERWWIYAENRPGLYSTIRGLERVLVRARVSELHMLTFVPSSYVYSDAVVVFALQDYYSFGLLQSSIHDAWLRRNASTMRTDVRYTPTDCFETFPFPPLGLQHAKAVEVVGREYFEHRSHTMLDRNIGLTKAYSLFHEPNCQDGDVDRLRELHIEMDRSILSSYGWEDVHAAHGFHANERGQTRFTVSPAARREILRRLLDLNLRVYQSERDGQTVQTSLDTPQMDSRVAHSVRREVV